MIKEDLNKEFNIGRLCNSYLIQTDNVSRALQETQEFLTEKIFNSSAGSFHQDLHLVERSEASSKNIAVDQIRYLHEFINKTSVVSGYKIGIIVNADEMNLNGANSCLKILEDTPKKSIIFLITNNPAVILPTIRSRCRKITHYFTRTNAKDIPQSILGLLNKNLSIDARLEVLKEFANKDRKKWLEFALSIEQLIIKFLKTSSGVQSVLSEQEYNIYKQLDDKSIRFLQSQLEKISNLIKDTIELDLDLRSSTLILLSLL